MANYPLPTSRNLKLFLIRRLLCFTVLACILGSHPQAGAAIVPGSKNLGAIWFIGDSITQGNADKDPNGYTMRSTLYNHLTAAGYTFNYTGHFTANGNGLPATGGAPSNNIYQYHSGVSGAVIGTNYSGRTGITQNIPIWWTNSTSRLPSVGPNVILLMIGANDCNLPIDMTTAPARLSQLIATIYAQPGVGNPTMLVAAITPDRVSAADTTNVAFFNAAVPGVVKQYQNMGDDVYMVDQFTILNANFSLAMNTDNLHPNSAGNNFMASNWLAAITGYVGATVPAAPCGFTATPTNALIALSWSVVPGALNGYNVKRATVSGGPYTTIATNQMATGYADTNVVNLTTYYYMVTAVNSMGESINSSELAATPSALPPPAAITATPSGNQVVLNWSSVPGATGYHVKRSQINGGPYSIFATNSTTTCTNGGLTTGVTYYYVVTAFNAQGESTNSTQVAVAIASPASFYIGDDAAEGTNITAGSNQDTVSTTLVYAFVQSGTLYTNTSGSPQGIRLTQVNCQAGTVSGSIQPFVATYTGGQNATDVAKSTNYNVLLAGEPIALAGNSSVLNTSFLAGGTNPVITLNPGGVLAAGYQTTAGGVIKYTSGGSGLVDYIYNGSSLPATFPNPFTANSTYSLDRTLKFNVGLSVNVVTTNTVTSSANPSIYNSNVTFTSTISPTPTNGESVTFMDGTNILGAGTLTNGQATFTISTLAPGLHSITAAFAGDAYYRPSASAALTQNVNGNAPTLTAFTSGNGQLNISWPAAGIGWLLQAQTNSLTSGLTTNWVTVPGSASVSNITITINPASGAVFYRMIHL